MVWTRSRLPIRNVLRLDSGRNGERKASGRSVIDAVSKMVKLLVMEAAIAEVKKNLCSMVDRVEKGETVIILRHGRPAAQLTPISGRKKRHAVAHDDPALYKGINLEEPVMEPIR